MTNFPLLLLTAAGAQVLCQIFKVVFYSLREGCLAYKYCVTAGGIPSSHTAFVTALAVAVGLKNGFFSDIFALCFVFGAIVIYDAYRLRGAVEKHAKLLNRLVSQRFPGEYEKLSEMVGHSLPEIAAGILSGGFFAWGVVSIFGF
ncbi:MAG: divergent PAP2 family protein [Spirochaetales bacterium]|jgi:acid phosphatase family membrane protein YuiD|nr:divergent PAP2 family protein [Spirochaetales bacterium]